MFVSFMKSQQDITPRLKALGIDNMNKKAQAHLVDSLSQAMTDSVKKTDKTLHVDIDAFYEGNKWYATTYQDFTDLRLVFTVPKSMGKYGGETDNWMWPRQTCDFSVFRVYCDPKTGGPAPYSKDNVPYHPKTWAKVSMDGYREGSFAMTVGYPGSTERYLSSYGIKEMRDCQNDPRQQVRGVKQEVMLRHMRASEAVRIKYDSKFAQSSNYWKNSIGMNKCIDSIGLVNQKRAYEEQIAQWQDTAKHLTHKVDFPLLEKLYARRSRLTKAMTQWSETFSRRSNIEFNARALRLMNEQQAKGSKKGEYFQFEDNADQWDAATDADMMAALLKNYREKADNDRRLQHHRQAFQGRLPQVCRLAFQDFRDAEGRQDLFRHQAICQRPRRGLCQGHKGCLRQDHGRERQGMVAGRQHCRARALSLRRQGADGDG